MAGGCLMLRGTVSFRSYVDTPANGMQREPGLAQGNTVIGE